MPLPSVEMPSDWAVTGSKVLSVHDVPPYVKVRKDVGEVDSASATQYMVSDET